MSTATTLNVTPKTAADEAQSFAEYKAVEAALQPYIESANFFLIHLSTYIQVS